MRLPRFTTLQLLLAAALVALVLGLFTSAWRVHVYQQIEQICFSPSGKLLAAKYVSGAVQVWRLDSSQLRLVGQAFSQNNLLGLEQSTIHFLADDKLLKVESDFGGTGMSTRVWQWDLNSGDVTSWMQIANCLAWPYAQGASTERLFIIDQSSKTNEVQSYLLGSKRFERKWKLPSQTATGMVLSADGKTLIVEAVDGQVHVIDVEADETQSHLKFSGHRPVAISGDGKWLATETLNEDTPTSPGVLTIRNLRTPGAPTLQIDTPITVPSMLSLTADASQFVVSDGQIVDCYEIAEGRRLGQFVLDERT